MHGFEYALAGLMMTEGMISGGLEGVRSVLDRCDGEKRNPWNEIECGSNYARSMASFSFLPILSGFVFDMTEKRIGWLPKIGAGSFRCLWSLDAAWGRVEIGAAGLTVSVLGGALPLREIVTGLKVSAVSVDGADKAFVQEGNTVRLAEDAVVREKIVLKA
jgi:hypothetical protein